jgi:cysteine desulfurase/selenocysteine lyase
MASDFFTALPDLAQLERKFPIAGAQSQSTSVLAESLAIPQEASGLTASTGAASPTEIDLRALPSTPVGAAVKQLPTPSITTPSSIPKIPGDLSTLNPISVPDFSFLQEARPLFGDIAQPAVHSTSYSAAAKTVPTFEIPGAEAFGVPSAISSSNAAPIAAPQIEGAPARPQALDRSKEFQFLHEIRQLSSVNVIPVVEPVRAEAAALPNLALSSRAFDVAEIRRDFPILQERVNGRQLVWLDNAATTQKPQSVIDRLNYFYSHENSNIHRAAHELAARATDAYEDAREKVRRFLHASSVREILFVRGATEGINLVAQSWGWQNVQRDDEVVITWLEHHANIVPWQMLCAEKGARLRVAPVDDTGQVLLDEYTKLLGPRTRLVSIAQVSNALGTVTPSREMIEIAHRYGATVLLDGAQAVSHMPVDVQLLDCDFFVFSGHKVFAPTGIGVVYGKSEILDRTPPWQGGGNMIKDVTFEKTQYQEPPLRFEAGTGSIADAVGLGAAIDYIERIGMANIARYEHELLAYALDSLRKIPGLHLIGAPKEQAGVVSFVLDGFRTEDAGAALNREGIAVRSGHHCAQPILRRFGVESSVRASLALYNTCEEIDALVAAIWNIKQGRSPGLL